ncbi:GPI transamidase component PIG-S [Aspergillus luchuensis]|uniref:GPI transamidase component PIG-S n=1 Tax=Aspergillus kawachii TaxID=1069201 RepID=A0A146F163_ASPKA|nr:GPI transamidase component PIG-S [Aspergillus luchuensis]
MSGRCQSWRTMLGRFSVHVERSIIEVPGALAEGSTEPPLPLRMMTMHKMNNGDCAIE